METHTQDSPVFHCQSEQRHQVPQSLFKVSPNQKFINNLNEGIENMVVKVAGNMKLGIVASTLED